MEIIKEENEGIFKTTSSGKRSDIENKIQKININEIQNENILSETNIFLSVDQSSSEYFSAKSEINNFDVAADNVVNKSIRKLIPYKHYKL